MSQTIGQKATKKGVCLVFYPERMSGLIEYRIEHIGGHPMMGNDIYEGKAKVQDLMIAPLEDWQEQIDRLKAQVIEIEQVNHTLAFIQETEALIKQCMDLMADYPDDMALRLSLESLTRFMDRQTEKWGKEDGV